MHLLSTKQSDVDCEAIEDTVGDGDEEDRGVKTEVCEYRSQSVDKTSQYETPPVTK